MLAYTVFTAAVFVYRPAAVTAVVQPNTVAPAGMSFDDSVSSLMAANEDMATDVAEMLVAAKMLSGAGKGARQGSEVDNALRFMDVVQRTTADMYDQMYDNFLDLYPNWCTYLMVDDPDKKDAAFAEYKRMLDRYVEEQKYLFHGLGYLVALQSALLPSNMYADPQERIAPSGDTANVLQELAENMWS